MNEVTREELLETAINLVRNFGDIMEVENQPMFMDASKEIEKAYMIDLTHMGYATMDMIGTSRGHDESTDYTEHEQSLLEKKAKWGQEVTSYQRGVTIDICRFRFNLDDIAFQRNMTRKEVLNHYDQALAKWVEMFFRGKLKK